MEKENDIMVAKPGQEEAWDPIDECPFPLDQLSPPFPLSAEDRAAVEAQKQK